MRDLVKLLATAAVGSAVGIPAAAHADPGCGANETASAPTLEQGFREPPGEARPRLWWHWMNGNITQDGIAKDIAWMRRIGIGGLHAFQIDLMTPNAVAKPVPYMSEDWKEAFRHGTRLADQAGLEFGVSSAPGWSETGGPWVKPADGMKKLVWSETTLRGGQRFAGTLTALPATTGPFQTLPRSAGIGQPRDKIPDIAGQSAVVAYRLRKTENEPRPSLVLADDTAADIGALLDQDFQTGIDLAIGADGAAIARLVYDRPTTISSATLLVPAAGNPFGGASLEARLEVESEPSRWRKVADIPLTAVPTTASFDPVTGRAFRIVVSPSANGDVVSSLSAGAPGVVSIFPPGSRAKSLKVSDLHLSAAPRVDAFELKAGFAVTPDYYALEARANEDTAGIAPSSVIDLTNLVTQEGRLDWTPPAGTWKVVRFGWSLTGATNHPSPTSATGLEADKFDAAAVRRYAETYFDTLGEVTGPGLIGNRGLCTVMADSIEAGPANWTPAMITQFKRLRGYDPTPWLPALTGVIIGSRQQSDGFLYDFRRTIADLLASEHYGTFAKVAHERGLQVYSEALEDHRPALGDDMAMRRYADVPTAAFWTYNPQRGPRPTYLADIKGAASVAHIYGQNLVGTEALTSAMAPWAYAPVDLKPIIDRAFVLGTNRPIIQSSVHQPLDDKIPGLSLFIFGQNFNRHETWAEMAGPWIDYLARSSYLLQQGRNVADVAYFYGEESPLTGLYGETTVADAPRRYAFDFANADALLEAFSVDGTDLVTSGGARYRLLYLGGSSRRMTLPVLRRIAELAKSGATIVGLAPESSPGLGDDRAAFAALLGTLWSGSGETRVGSGRVIASTDVEAALRQLGADPDFEYAPRQTDSDIAFVHRRFDMAGETGDNYFLVNQGARAETIEARFRVNGKAPEIWHADTGKTEAVSYRIEGGQTLVPLSLGAGESVHVVFRKAAAAQALAVASPSLMQLGKIETRWTVNFQPGRGAPASTTMEQLTRLDQNPDPAIRYFSGVATYETGFNAPRGWTKDRPLWLDLGAVHDLAEVSVNGKAVGAAWHAPYRLDVGAATKPGRNRLTVRVANLWVNRLIGDAQPAAKKITSTSLPTYKPDAPLRPSGLAGPITLLGEGK